MTSSSKPEPVPAPVPTPPPLLFAIRAREIRQHEHVEPIYRRVERANVWIPPLHFGQSITDEDCNAYHHHRDYFFNGNKLEIIPTVSSVDDTTLFELKRVTSIYYDNGQFWVVPFDVTGPEPDDDDDDDDDDDEPSDPGPDGTSEYIMWNRPSFDWPSFEDGRGKRIYLGHSTICLEEGFNEQVRATRKDHYLHQVILPRAYHPDDPRRVKLSNVEAPVGSLNGDLSLLVALLAFVAHPTGTHVEDTFKHCIKKGSWRPPKQAEADGWQPKRGLLVQIYLPISRDEHGKVVNTEPHLQAYEDSLIFE